MGGCASQAVEKERDKLKEKLASAGQKQAQVDAQTQSLAQRLRGMEALIEEVGGWECVSMHGSSMYQDATHIRQGQVLAWCLGMPGNIAHRLAPFWGNEHYPAMPCISNVWGACCADSVMALAGTTQPSWTRPPNLTHGRHCHPQNAATPAGTGRSAGGAAPAGGRQLHRHTAAAGAE